MSVKDSDKCECCGSPSNSVYVVKGKTLALCDDCKKVFHSYVDANDKNQKKVDKAEEKLSEIAQQRKSMRGDTDQKYIEQYSNLISFDLKPQEIYDKLNQYVVGQDDVKRKISVAVRRHYKRISLRIHENWDDEWSNKEVTANHIPKENILLIGPTGSGKTYSCRILSEIVSVPFWAAAMTAFTEDGYVGESVENLISSLLREAGYYNPLAECGILFLDEIDKKAMKTAGNPSITRDVSGEGVQSAILDMMDTHGSIMNVGLTLGNRRNAQRYTEKFNTRDVLFILGGAFPGLEDIIRKRIKGRSNMGFNTNPIENPKQKEEILNEVLPEDIVEYGFLPELVGRIGSISVLSPLDKDDMKKILLDVDNAIIKQQSILAEMEDFELEFTPEALDAIIDKALDSGMGARRLKAIVSNTTDQIFFDLPKCKKIRILPETVEDPSKYEKVS